MGAGAPAPKQGKRQRIKGVLAMVRYTNIINFTFLLYLFRKKFKIICISKHVKNTCNYVCHMCLKRTQNHVSQKLSNLDLIRWFAAQMYYVNKT